MGLVHSFSVVNHVLDSMLSYVWINIIFLHCRTLHSCHVLSHFYCFVWMFLIFNYNFILQASAGNGQYLKNCHVLFNPVSRHLTRNLESINSCSWTQISQFFGVTQHIFSCTTLNTQSMCVCTLIYNLISKS